MATITKREGKNGVSYLIKVSCGYNNGKQIIQSMTWTPPKGNKWCEKTLQRKLEEQVSEFTGAVKKGRVTSAVKFEKFGERWFEKYAPYKLKPQTIRTYRHLSKRVYKAIGHMRLDNISTDVVRDFMNGLSKEMQYNSKGEEIGYLSPKTVKEHVGFISTVLSFAEEEGLVPFNPCKKIKKVKVELTKEREVYTAEEVKKMLELFEQESETNFKYVVFFTLAAFTGLRRGELLGLEWKDIDFDKNLLCVVRTSAWTKERGIYTDTPKTKSSRRNIAISDYIKDLLIKYKAWQDDYKASLGDKWIEHDRLFTKINGEPMGLRSPYKFFEKFCKRTGMRFVNVHSFRHFAASALVMSNNNVKDIQEYLGHSSVTTTVSTRYGHTRQKQPKSDKKHEKPSYTARCKISMYRTVICFQIIRSAV